MGYRNCLNSTNTSTIKLVFISEKMEIMKKMEIDLIKDRGIVKWRINLVKENYIYGFFKPVKFGGEDLKLK